MVTKAGKIALARLRLEHSIENVKAAHALVPEMMWWYTPYEGWVNGSNGRWGFDNLPARYVFCAEKPDWIPKL